MLIVKTKYGEFDYEFSGAKFRLKEVDVKEYSSEALNLNGNEIKFNSKELLRKLVIDCIVSWEGVVDEDKKELPCTDKNKVILTYDIKLAIFGAIQNRCSLNEAKKKS